MPAPSIDLIVENPAPLNPFRVFPFRLDEFPADAILGLMGRLSGALAAEEPRQLDPLSARKEVR